MTPSLASRAASWPSWLALWFTTFGTLVVVVPTLAQRRLAPDWGEPTRCYRRPPSPEELRQRADHRLVEAAIEAKRPELEACLRGDRFFLAIHHEIENGRVLAVEVDDNASTAAKAVATSRCFRRVLDQVEFPVIARPLHVTTRRSLTGDALDVVPNAGESTSPFDNPFAPRR